MATDSEIEFFSITPLHDPASEAVQRRQVRTAASPRWVTLAQAGGWIIAAALAVLASFAPVYRIHGRLPDQSQLSGNPASNFSFYVDGWGRPRLHDSGPLSVDDTLNGPRYGLGFCVCAALMVLAAILVIAGPRLLASLGPRWRARLPRRLASMVGIAAALLLAGSAGSAALATLPIRTQVHALDYETFGFGWSLPLAGLSGVVCVLIWSWAAGWAQHWDGLAASDLTASDLTASDLTASDMTATDPLPPADATAENQDDGDTTGEDRPVSDGWLRTDASRPEPPEPDLSAWRPPVDRLQ